MTTRHNVCINPACGANVTGWAGGSTPTRSTGLAGLPVTTGAHYSANNFAQTPAGVASASVAYTGSFYVNNGAGVALNSITLYLAFTRSAGGDDFSHTTTVNLPTGVSRVSLTATAPANTTGVYMVLDTFNASLGSGVDLTACLLEAASSADTYFDGNTTNGSWDGTANNSASTLTDTPAGPAVSVWNGTSEVSATVTVWNGTTEVTASVDAIAP